MCINSGDCMRFQNLPRLASFLGAGLRPLICKGEWRFTDEGKDYLGLITFKMGTEPCQMFCVIVSRNMLAYPHECPGISAFRGRLSQKATDVH